MTAVVALTRRHTWGTGVARVRLLVAGLASVAVLMVIALRDSGTHLGKVSLPWYALAVAFAITQLMPVHFEFRRQSHLVTLTQLPLVLGLFFATPMSLVTGAAAATLFFEVAIRRTEGLKASFNVANQAFVTALAAAAFHALAEPGLSPGTWPAVLAATVSEDILGAATVSAVISLHEGRWHRPPLRRLFGFSLAVTVVDTSLALVAATSVYAEPSTVWVLVLFACLGMFVFRTYNSLSARHAELNRLYDLSRGLGPMVGDAEELSPILHQARELIYAERLQLVLLEEHVQLSVTVSADGDAQVSDDLADLHPAVSRVLRSGRPLLRERRRNHLTRVPVRQAENDDLAVVPVQDGARMMGVLSAVQRSSQVRGFEPADLKLLETIAGQLATALEKGRLVNDLRRAAESDSLTGLANLDRIRSAVTEQLSRSGGVGVVLLLDVDRFSDLNDTLGHDAGDRVLFEVAQRLLTVASPDSVVARIGADQFAIAVGRALTIDLDQVIRTIKAGVEGPIRTPKLSADVNVTIGVARAPLHGSDATTLLRRAEIAMSAAKAAAAAAAEWRPELEAGATRRLALLTGLRDALTAGDIEVAYQPKVSLSSGRVVSFEALARWTHPELGPVSPVEFIPLVETSGLVGMLTTTVLERALHDCAGWMDAGRPVGVAVNLSARSLADPAIVAQVAAALGTSGVPARRLTLEITESSVMDSHGRAVAVLRELRKLGVRLSIDDFGTGYSSLGYVKGLPVHELKVDKAFVEEIDRDPADRAVVRAVVEIARAFGLVTVAEGVEDVRQLETLTGIGVDEVQGFVFARPMSAAGTGEWLRSRLVPAARAEEA